MAVPWIKMRTNLESDPRVAAVAAMLTGKGKGRFPRLHVVGGLFMLWAIGDEHSIDGLLPGYSADLIDERFGKRGFSAALEKVDWLEIGDGWIRIPRFDDHNGESSKRRSATNDRVAKYRARNASSVTKLAKCNANVTLSSLQKALPEEEEERDEEIEEENAPTALSENCEEKTNAGGESLDSEIRQFVGGHRMLTWDQRTHGKLRKLVEKAGWDRAKELVEQGIGAGAAFPVGWALGAYAKAEQAAAAAPKRKNKLDETNEAIDRIFDQEAP